MKHLQKFENFFLEPNDEELDDQRYLDKKLKEVKPEDDLDCEVCDHEEEEEEDGDFGLDLEDDDKDNDDWFDDEWKDEEPKRKVWGDEIDESRRYSKRASARSRNRILRKR